jgi:hypothetical protein
MKRVIILVFILSYANANANEIFYYKNNQKIELTPIKTTQKLQKSDSTQTIDYYKTRNNITVGVTKEIIVKIKEEEALEGILEQYAINLKKRLTSTLYLVETNSSTLTLEISNQLYHDANVSYAHPNFIKKIDKR